MRRLKESLQIGEIKALKFVTTDTQLADGLTKPKPNELIRFLETREHTLETQKKKPEQNQDFD